MRNADGELDHLQAALNVAQAVRDRLSVLGRKQLGQRLHLLGDDFEELDHHASAPLRVLRGPCRLCSAGVGDDLRDFGRAGQGNAGLNLARMWSVNIREPAGLARDPLAPCKVVNCAHDAPPVAVRCRSLKSMGAGPGVQALKPGKAPNFRCSAGCAAASKKWKEKSRQPKDLAPAPPFVAHCRNYCSNIATARFAVSRATRFFDSYQPARRPWV